MGLRFHPEDGISQNEVMLDASKTITYMSFRKRRNP